MKDFLDINFKIYIYVCINKSMIETYIVRMKFSL